MIDTNTQQSVAVLHRYNEDVRTIVSVQKPGIYLCLNVI